MNSRKTNPSSEKISRREFLKTIAVSGGVAIGGSLLVELRFQWFTIGPLFR